MSSGADAMPEAAAASQTAAPATFPWTRTLYWSVRRELWEHRYVYLAPLVVAALAVFGHFLSALLTPAAERAATLADPGKAHEFMSMYGAATFVMLMTGFVVGAIYSLGALHGERRDRSILFWKSLPVSDLMSVMSKAVIPIILLPLMVLALVVAATLLMITLQTVAWQLDGFDPRELWKRLDLPNLWLCLIYGMPFMALWYAPLYAWMLLVSAWARRVTFLWAVAPIAAVLIFEHLAFRHAPGLALLERRLSGGIREPYSVGGDGKVWIKSLSDLDPVRLYGLPDLWIGLALAALLLVAAARLRRSHGPI